MVHQSDIATFEEVDALAAQGIYVSISHDSRNKAITYFDELEGAY